MRDEVSIGEIRESFLEEKLEYLVGAGTSIGAGLPDWHTLKHQLLRTFFDEEFRQEDSSLLVEPEPDELAALANVFVDRFAHESAIDVIRFQLEDRGERFSKLLRETLYASPAGVELQPVQYELAAALSSVERLITTNFDTLLEQAFGYLNDCATGYDSGSIDIVAAEDESGDDESQNPQVVHLHGYLPRNARLHGRLVLSERDFAETSDAWPTHVLKGILNDPERDLLVTGMSLADPRLRSLLLDRSKEKEPPGRVFALLTKSFAAYDAPLAERRAHKLLHRYELDYWERLGVHIKWVEDHQEIPMLLRQTRLGSDCAEWCKKGSQYLSEETSLEEPLSEAIYSETNQRIASTYLDEQIQYLRRSLDVDEQEELTIGYFVPSPSSSDRIQLAFRYNDQFLEDPYRYPTSDDAFVHGVTEERAAERVLRVESIEEAQGAAGYAFVTGKVVEALRGSKEMNRKFTTGMIREWDSGRTFSSLLCVPIYGGPEWLPLGVGFVSSNRNEPFWAVLPAEETLFLQRLVRSTYGRLLRLGDES